MRFICLFFTLTFLSCSDKDCNYNTSLPIYISVDSYVDAISNLEDIEMFSDFVLSNKKQLFPFFEVQDSIDFMIKREDVFSLIDNIYFDSLHLDVRKTFPAPQYLFQDLDNAIRKYNANSNIKLSPKITFLITGFFNDIIVDSKDIIIGLDYFLERSNKFKPTDLPAYILDRYTPNHLNSIALSSYLSQYNLINEVDQTLINEIISFGKLYYVVSELLDCTSDNVVLGYSEEELSVLEDNEAFIYSFFLQNELLFVESNLIKQKYLSERPSTFEIDKSVPGRVGRWLGWKIVSSYMSNSTYSLEELLREDDYKNIFYNSNYNPI